MPKRLVDVAKEDGESKTKTRYAAINRPVIKNNSDSTWRKTWLGRRSGEEKGATGASVRVLP